MITIELVTELPMSRDEAFDLSLDVNAHTDSMAASGEAPVAGITSGRLALEDEVTWRAWHFGIHPLWTCRFVALSSDSGTSTYSKAIRPGPG